MKRDGKWLILFLILGVTLPAVLWLAEALRIQVWIGAGYGAAFLAAALLWYRRERRQNEWMLVQLSELIESLSDPQVNQVFPLYEDTLVSKLQAQVSGLSDLMRRQNQKTENQHAEIKSLVSDVAHQLKTPLANVQTYTTLLRETQLTQAERQEFEEILNGALQKMNFLIEGMIKSSRLESGIIQVRREEASLNDTLLQAIKQVYRAAKEKDITINLEEQRRITLVHDPKWTAEALYNLLDNAVKYTPAGGKITVSIQSYEMFSRIDVRDTGRGIPEADQPLVFQRFYRGADTAGEEGVGLGLYLCREIILRQGGYMRLKSDGSGSVFSVFLPNDGPGKNQMECLPKI